MPYSCSVIVGDLAGLLAVGYEQFGDPVKLEENPMQHLFEVNHVYQLLCNFF